MLGTAALIWIAAGTTAPVFLRGKNRGGLFSVWWLMTLTGSLGVFIAADVASFYVFFTLVSLAAYGLVVFDDTSSVRRAGAVYVSFALLGEAFLLMAFVLLASATPDHSLLIRDGMAALAASPWRATVIAFLILGFGVKIGLVPLHVWMPLTYSAAPFPAAAALSGAAVKAGVIGLIRFLPFETALPDWGMLLAAVGLFSAYYGVVIGITQTDPKTILAYSSVSQMGFLAAVLGAGLAAGDGETSLLAAFYAVHHILVKGGLFLALGAIAVMPKARALWWVMLPAAFIALGFGGLPLTGGALAKLAVKDTLGYGTIGGLGTLAAAGSTLLMLHFLRLLWDSTSRDAQAHTPAGLLVPWLAIAAASLVLPWTLYPEITNASVGDVLAAKVIWAGLWPVLLGVLLAAGLWRYRNRLPCIEPGDLIAAGKGAVQFGVALAAAAEKSRHEPSTVAACRRSLSRLDVAVRGTTDRHAIARPA